MWKVRESVCQETRVNIKKLLRGNYDRCLLPTSVGQKICLPEVEILEGRFIVRCF